MERGVKRNDAEMKRSNKYIRHHFPQVLIAFIVICIGRTLFDRPKPTVGCSANGRRRIIYLFIYLCIYLFSINDVGYIMPS